MRIEAHPVIAVRTESVASWGALEGPSAGEPSVLDAVRGRRSVRRYLPKGVPDAAVERVLEAARWAPSPHGRQPWRFAVVRKDETKERLADAMGEEWRGKPQMGGEKNQNIQKGPSGSREGPPGAPGPLLFFP